MADSAEAKPYFSRRSVRLFPLYIYFPAVRVKPGKSGHKKAQSLLTGPEWLASSEASHS